MADENFRDLNRLISHKECLGLSLTAKAGGVSPALVQYVRDRMRMNLWGEMIERKIDQPIIDEILDNFDTQFWPLLLKHFENNPGTMKFLREFGVWSSQLMTFLIDSWMHPALAMLPARLLAHDMITDDIVVLSPHNSLFPFCFDKSFRAINYRMNTEARICLDPNVKRVLLLGSGLLLPYITDNYPLGHDGQKIVAYDNDPAVIPYIEKMLGGKLEDFGIELRIGDFWSVLYDDTQREQYDAVLFGGVWTYYLDRLSDIVERSYGLLKLGGYLYGDLQIFGMEEPEGNEPPATLSRMIYGFDGYVIDFPKMNILSSYVAAVDLMKGLLEKTGFDLVRADFSTEPFDAAKGESPAAMITVVQK